MTRKNAEILLAAVVLARSASFLFNKILLDTMSPFTLMGMRFLLAGTVLMVLFRKRFVSVSHHTFFKGVFLGFVFFLMMSAELFGLKTVSSSAAALLEGTAIIFVPIFESFIRRTVPSKRMITSTILSFGGVSLLTSGGMGFSMGPGAFLCLSAAVIYAVCMILTDRMSKDEDSVVLGTLQVTFMGVFGMIFSLMLETPVLPQSTGQWAAMLFLIIVCSSFGFAMQPVAQKYTTSERTAVLGALNPMGAAVLGIIFLHEPLGITGLLGGMLIICGLLIQSVKKEQLAGE